LAVDDFEILTPTEVEASTEPLPEEPLRRVRKLCACGCGEEVSGNRALKRGHTMGEGLPASIFGGNDIVVFQAAMVMLIGAISAGLENKLSVPKMESEEATAIGEPLGRIAARHIPKSILKRMKPGDAADAIAIITVMSAYTIRITTQKKEDKVVATNGHINNSGVSGQTTTAPLQQYQYRPPEQNFQPQNGGAN
jgi:hypothetical protein